MLVSTQAGFTFLLLARWFLTNTHASMALLSIPDGTVVSDEERMQRWMLAVTFTLMAGCVLQQEEGSSSGREWWVLPRSVAATQSARCDQRFFNFTYFGRIPKKMDQENRGVFIAGPHTGGERW